MSTKKTEVIVAHKIKHGLSGLWFYFYNRIWFIIAMGLQAFWKWCITRDCPTLN